MKIVPAYFSLAGASAYLGGALSVRSLCRLISRQVGGLPFIRDGSKGKIMIKRQDLDDWLAVRRHEPLNLDEIASKAVREVLGG